MDILSQEITVVLIASAFFLIVAVGIVMLFLVYQKRQLKSLLEKEELSNQFQKELLNTKLEAQEETLNHIGRELHDNIGQLLSSSKLLIGAANRSASTASETLEIADKTLSQAIAELRALSKSLNNNWLEKFDIIENLHTEVNRINSTHIKVTFDHPSAIKMPVDRQIMLFRMVQETFQNSIKHGRASNISIKANQNEQTLSISVEDNGKGFNLEEIKMGVGMINIQNRAQLLGGSAQWQSSEKGTLVLIQLPIYATA